MSGDASGKPTPSYKEIIRSIIDLEGLDASYLHLNSVSLLHNAVMPTFHKENSVLPLSVPPYKEREAITGWRVTDTLYPISLECIS